MLEPQSESISDNLRDLPANEVIDSLASWATANKLPFAVYRLPNQQHFELLIGSTAIPISDDEISEVDAGFLFSTYEGEHYFIDEGIKYNSIDRELIINPHWPAAIQIDTLGLHNTEWQHYIKEDVIHETQKEEYIQYVEKSIAQINLSELIKVVPSRTKKITFDDDQNLSKVFIKLCASYQNAFISLLSTPEFGTWVGASPETLIEVSNNGIFKTMSLAGTQPHKDEQPLHTLPWTQKEIEEQAMVSRFIINRFKEIRLREFEEVGPRTVKAGNLAHLCSTFKVDTIATDHPDLGSTMLKLLHPTSAVCGMPKELAQDHLKSIEKHDRKLYSGYLGPVNMPEGSHIYVNLRCMEVLKDEAVLYAGAGVTAYSMPEDEWEETELKCKTMLNIIQG